MVKFSRLRSNSVTEFIIKFHFGVKFGRIAVFIKDKKTKKNLLLRNLLAIIVIFISFLTIHLLIYFLQLKLKNNTLMKLDTLILKQYILAN